MCDYEIVVNPTNVDDWKSCVDQAYVSNDWRLSYNDYAEFLKIFGHENFQLFVAKEKASRKVIGFVLFALHDSVNGSPKIAQLGSYWVSPEMRGQGIGDKLFKMAIAKQRDCGTNLTLNAVQRMSPKYAERYGFDKLADWHLATLRIRMDDAAPERLTAAARTAVCVSDWSEVELERILEFDREIFCGVDRRRFLWHYLRRTDLWTKIATDPSSGSVTGMCSIKAMIGNRLMVCPLYADTSEIAESLLKATLESIVDFKQYVTLVLYVPNCNNSAVDLVDRLSQGTMEKLHNVQSQFTKRILPVPIERVYAITSYALTFV